jgi:hypothetical protein
MPPKKSNDAAAGAPAETKIFHAEPVPRTNLLSRPLCDSAGLPFFSFESATPRGYPAAAAGFATFTASLP